MKKLLLILLLLPIHVNASWEEFESCVDARTADPILKAFIDKLNWSKNEFEKMTNDTYASDEELKHIKDYATITEDCKNEQLSKISKHEQERDLYVHNWLKFQDSRTTLLADLYLRKITFSTYNKSRKDDYQAVNERRLNLNKFYEQKEAEQRYYDQQQRAERSRLLGEVFGNMGNSIRNMQKPSVTCNPTGFGGFNCR